MMDLANYHCRGRFLSGVGGTSPSIALATDIVRCGIYAQRLKRVFAGPAGRPGHLVASFEIGQAGRRVFFCDTGSLSHSEDSRQSSD